MTAFTIRDLIIYPIKGIQGISLDSVEVLQRGLKHDRRLMLVDAEGTFISQRTHPQLVNIYPEQIQNGFQLNYNQQSLKVIIEGTELSREISVTVFEHEMTAYHLSDIYDKWFSQILDCEVSLVYMPENGDRIKNLKRGKKDHVNVSFADGYPILILGTASMIELNKNLETQVRALRFRPNIIVDTAISHSEDYWDEISIGACKLQNIKPCARCNVITIDQSTGVINKEALKMLSSYRKIKNKVYFGTNAIILNEGYIMKGDQLTVHSLQEGLQY